MTVVFNNAGLVAFGAGFAGWALAQVAGHPAMKLIVGFGVLMLVAVALELRLQPETRPRYFWIVPAWLIGALGLGCALIDVNSVTGYAVVVAASAATATVIARDIKRKPGGGWLGGLLVAGAVVASWQVVAFTHPEWKHPLLYGVNGVAMLVCLVCGVQLFRARQSADDAPQIRAT